MVDYFVACFMEWHHQKLIWNNASLLLMFHIFGARIKQPKKEGSPFAFLMMLLSTVGKQQLGNNLKF
jgi:hypothetical protein